MAAALRSLIRLRRATPALRHGDFCLLWRDGQAFAFVRQHQDEQVLVLINRGPAVGRIDIALPRITGAELVWGACRVSVAQDEVTRAQVPAGTGCCVLVRADR